jgi:hypothetical protein
VDNEPGTSLRAERERDPAAFARNIDEIRAALRRHLDEASLRHAAREVGMSPTGLSKFLDGAEPYLPTVMKLRAWHAAHASGPGHPAGNA